MSLGAEYLALIGAVFVLNVMPAFAPPTWMLLTFLGLAFPAGNGWAVAGLAAAAATAGRGVLAMASRRLLRSRWVPEAMRGNLGRVGAAIQHRRKTAGGMFLLFAISPLPSNALFLAYGLTKAPLALILLPFFIGRSFSYALAFSGSAAVARRFDLELGTGASIGYFVVSQCLSLGLVYGFTRLDWQRSWAERRVRWVATRHAAPAPPVQG